MLIAAIVGEFVLMANAGETRASQIEAFEAEAELLVVHQLDLLAQIEAQLRTVHHTVRRIERLRTAQRRVGPELSNGQRETTLVGLSAELAALDKQLLEEHECCVLMQDTIKHMQKRLADLKHVAARLEKESSEEPSERAGSLDGRLS
jgi:hypothetical protein